VASAASLRWNRRVSCGKSGRRSCKIKNQRFAFVSRSCPSLKFKTNSWTGQWC